MITLLHLLQLKSRDSEVGNTVEGKEKVETLANAAGSENVGEIRELTGEEIDELVPEDDTKWDSTSQTSSFDLNEVTGARNCSTFLHISRFMMCTQTNTHKHTQTNTNKQAQTNANKQINKHKLYIINPYRLLLRNRYHN